MATQSGIALRNVSFAYPSADPLFTDLSIYCPPGFTGIVGANGSGKTTLLQLLSGRLEPVSGHVDGVTDVHYCAQVTDDPPSMLSEFLDDWQPMAIRWRERLQVGADYLERWSTLSHGERKRAQIAVALWRSPQLLAIDEPTNHIDGQARRLLLDALQQYRGVGLMVSHDRELLDALCQQCLWLEPPSVQRFVGGVSQALQAREQQQRSAQQQRTKFNREAKRVRREVVKRRDKAAREHQTRSKRGLANKDSDAREKINRARVTDGGAGGDYRALNARLGRTEDQLAEARITKVYQAGIWLDGSRSKRDTVLTLPAGSIPLGNRVLRWPALSIKPEQRIAVMGPNGAGKSTWIEHVVPRLNVAADQQVVVPQEVSVAAAAKLSRHVRSLPKTQLGHIMTIISRLNSRPQRLLHSEQPSPGEVRKLLLALGMSKAPHVIVMDEPTNHLDLPSIEALESALMDCPCALIVVSHDQRFIERIGASRWSIERDELGDSVLVTE